MAQEPTVRSLHLAVRVERADPPNDTAHVRLYYPAAPTGSDEERLTGVLPPDRSAAPLPLVLFLPAVNVPSASYRWLASDLVGRGFAVATYDHVGELVAGLAGLSPGIDLSALGPAAFGTRPSATAVGPVLGALAELGAKGSMQGTAGMQATAGMQGRAGMQGLLDLDRVALGGHSAGGTVALENADPAWFPGVRAVFAYGSHTVPVAALGHPEGTVLPVGPVPALLLTGDRDGVISASADRYGAEVDAPGHSPVAATFEHAVRGDRPAYEVVFAGANHVLVCDPHDPTSARGFLEPRAVGDTAATRRELADVLGAFLARHVGDDPANRPLEVAAAADSVASARARGAGTA